MINKDSEDKISNIIISVELITSWSKNLFKMLRIIARGNSRTVRLPASYEHDIWPALNFLDILTFGTESECSYLSFEFQI